MVLEQNLIQMLKLALPTTAAMKRNKANYRIGIEAVLALVSGVDLAINCG